MEPIFIEILAPTLSGIDMSYRGCGMVMDYVGLRSKYRNACINEYPTEWKEAVRYLSEWIKRLLSLYPYHIQVRLIDAQSPLGLWKQIRHRLFRFPAFIINHRETYIGWDTDQLEELIDSCLKQAL
ncbi:MAG: hypothetical protein DRG63_12360 [Deltaproteobacteria bacterium]|nr:MAG: hypothetical protein DRG63_12360 [Deltaproteobacteria bacterium]